MEVMKRIVALRVCSLAPPQARHGPHPSQDSKGDALHCRVGTARTPSQDSKGEALHCSLGTARTPGRRPLPFTALRSLPSCLREARRRGPGRRAAAAEWPWGRATL